MKKITLFTFFLIALGIINKLYAQNLDITNNSACAVDVSLKAVDWSTGSCVFAGAGPITVASGGVVTLTSPLSSGVTYWALVSYCSGTTAVVGDCSSTTMGPCAISPCLFSTTNTLTSSCTCTTLNLTFVGGSSSVNSTLTIY